MLPLSFANINYTCAVDQNASPGLDLNNTAKLKDYYSTSVTADQNPSTNFVKKTIESSTELILPEDTNLTKILYGSSLPDTTGTDLNPGEIAKFEITATLGEGTYEAFNIVDNTCGALTLESNSANVIYSSLGNDLVVVGTPGNSIGTISFRCEYQNPVAGAINRNNTVT
jgi:hypothetical protein